MQYYIPTYTGAPYSFIGIEILPMYYSKESFYRAVYYIIYIDGVIQKYGVLSHKRVQNSNKYKSINNLYVIRIKAYRYYIYQLTYQHFIRLTYIYI